MIAPLFKVPLVAKYPNPKVMGVIVLLPIHHNLPHWRFL